MYVCTVWWVLVGFLLLLYITNDDTVIVARSSDPLKHRKERAHGQSKPFASLTSLVLKSKHQWKMRRQQPGGFLANLGQRMPRLNQRFKVGVLQPQTARIASSYFGGREFSHEKTNIVLFFEVFQVGPMMANGGDFGNGWWFFFQASWYFKQFYHGLTDEGWRATCLLIIDIIITHSIWLHTALLVPRALHAEWQALIYTVYKTHLYYRSSYMYVHHVIWSNMI